MGDMWKVNGGTGQCTLIAESSQARSSTLFDRVSVAIERVRMKVKSFEVATPGTTKDDRSRETQRALAKFLQRVNLVIRIGALPG